MGTLAQHTFLTHSPHSIKCPHMAGKRMLVLLPPPCIQHTASVFMTCSVYLPTPQPSPFTTSFSLHRHSCSRISSRNAHASGRRPTAQQEMRGGGQALASCTISRSLLILVLQWTHGLTTCAFFALSDTSANKLLPCKLKNSACAANKHASAAVSLPNQLASGSQHISCHELQHHQTQQPPQLPLLLTPFPRSTWRSCPVLLTV